MLLADGNFILYEGDEVMISIIILTYNDEVQIENCLNSLSNLSDDIVVIDSYSKDNTLAICKNYGARVFQNPFVNQAIQFNWGLDNIELKYDWVLRLDSDEILPDRVKREIANAVQAPAEFKGFYLNRRMYWMGRWLRYGRMYPHFILRLFKKGFARYEEKTEEHLIVEGSVGFLKCDFLEDNRKNNLDYFTEKHLQTARGELGEIQNSESANVLRSLEPRLFGHKVNRTRWLKENIYMRIPLFIRSFFYFFYRYFICLGFLDGKPGLIFHVLQAFWYRFYIDAKVYEAKLDNNKSDYKDI